MGRIYYVQTGAQTVSAAQDLLEILAASGKHVILHGLIISQSSDAGDTESEQLRVDVKRATGSYTSGSGGGTATIGKQNHADAAEAFTKERNNTTQAAAGSGALTTLHSEAFNVQAGYQFIPTPEMRMNFAPAEALVVSIPAPSDALTMMATAIVEELG